MMMIVGDDGDDGDEGDDGDDDDFFEKTPVRCCSSAAATLSRCRKPWAFDSEP